MSRVKEYYKRTLASGFLHRANRICAGSKSRRASQIVLRRRMQRKRSVIEPGTRQHFMQIRFVRIAPVGNPPRKYGKFQWFAPEWVRRQRKLILPRGADKPIDLGR